MIRYSELNQSNTSLLPEDAAEINVLEQLTAINENAMNLSEALQDISN